MNYLSVCSGIEAATCAWHPLGWQPFGFSEVDAFPSAVLKHHYPDTPNFGDMTKFKEWPHAAIDLLVGGTPCQSFSVAGLRKGLDDPRGNLMLTYLAIADRYRPRWLVWENVPGVLSSGGGADFGALLGGLAELGYGFAYRVLDAQYFGVAQRRRRVFVVGHLGDWRRAAAVLFERHSLQGHPAPRRQAGERPAPTVRAGAANGGAGHGARSGDSKDELIVPVEPLCVSTGQAGAEIGAEIGADMAPTLNCNHEAPYIAHSLRGEGFDASEDGTGRGTPLVPVAFDTTQITSAANYSNPQPGDACHPLAAGAHAPAIAFHGSQDPSVSGDVTHPCGRNGGRETCVAVSPAPTFAAATEFLPQSSRVYSEGEASPTLQATGRRNGNRAPQVATFQQSSQAGKGTIGYDDSGVAKPCKTQADGQMVHAGMQVRRLTPRECERLQGFPDDYTLIPHRNKPAADGPRYKALGNSMAVPVMRWIGERIALVDAIEAEERAA